MRFTPDMYIDIIICTVLFLACAWMLGVCYRGKKRNTMNEADVIGWTVASCIVTGIAVIILISIIFAATQEAQTQREESSLQKNYPGISIVHLYNTPRRDIEFMAPNGSRCFGNLQWIGKDLKIFDADCGGTPEEYHVEGK